MEFISKNIKDFLRERITIVHIIILVSLLITGIIVRNHLAMVFLLAIFLITEIIFDIILKFTLKPIYRFLPLGIELVTFETVILGYAFGPVIGAVFGILFGLTYYGIIFGFRSSYQLVNIPMYGIMGYLAGTIPAESILGLGMLLALIYGIITSFIIFIVFGGKISKSLIFLASNLAFNYWVFSHISSVVLRIIT